MPSKKSIFRQPGAKHFQLVHRSQRDPLIHDSDASLHVLKPFERENAKKGKTREELEKLLSPTDLEHDRTRNVGEAALYDIYYDDTEYDYMQHLRSVGTQDGVESILIEAPLLKKNHVRSKETGLEIPHEVLPSLSELPQNYESQQAVPESIAGFQPDMDPHLRQVLEALEDDAFVDDDLDDGFFGELITGGQRASDDDSEFEFDENGIDEGGGNGEIEHEGFYESDGNKGSSRELGWEERFALFKRNQRQKGQVASSDDELPSEDGDTVGGLPTISVIGRKGKRRTGNSNVSSYSMSSSSIYRNEALQTLDERFEQIMEKEYNGEESGGTPADNSENSDSDLDEAPELITSREDFGAIVNEFLHDYEILGGKMKPKLEGETGADKLDKIRRAFGQDDRVHITGYDDDDVRDATAVLDTTQREDRWDCETILSTYSNLENHPRIIRVSGLKSVPKISIDPRTGFPFCSGTPSGVTDKNSSAVESDSGPFHKCVTISRSRNESKEEKKTRKAAAKSEKQIRRAGKHAIKEQFEAELKSQKRTLANKVVQVRKL